MNSVKRIAREGDDSVRSRTRVRISVASLLLLASFVVGGCRTLPSPPELADVQLWIQDENWTYKEGIATAYKANLTVIKNKLATAGTGADIRFKFTNF